VLLLLLLLLLLLCTCSYDVPLVADIHFQPAVAMMVAEAFEKVSYYNSVALVEIW
jgi:hypothetical protein